MTFQGVMGVMIKIVKDESKTVAQKQKKDIWEKKLLGGTHAKVAPGRIVSAPTLPSNNCAGPTCSTPAMVVIITACAVRRL